MALQHIKNWIQRTDTIHPKTTCSKEEVSFLAMDQPMSILGLLVTIRVFISQR